MRRACSLSRSTVVLVSCVAQQALVADRQAGQTRIADIGRLPGGGAALVDGENARRQAGSAVVAQLDGGQRVARMCLGLVERQAADRQLAIDDRHRKGAAGPDVDRLRKLERNLGEGFRRRRDVGGACHLARRHGRRRWRGGSDAAIGFATSARWHGRRRRDGAAGFLLPFLRQGREVSGHAALVGPRQDAADDLDWHVGTVDVIGLVQRLAEGHRAARHQGQFDVVPGVAGHVLQHCPALHAGLGGAGVRRQGDAVGGFPHRHRDDIGRAHDALAAAAQADGQGARIAGAVLAHGGQRLADLLAQGRIVELQVLRLFEDELLHRAVGGQHRNAVALALLAAVLADDGFRRHGDDPAAQHARTGNGNLRPLQRLHQRSQRAQRVLAERQAAERLLERFLARQADAADAALVVVHDEALQHVVDLVEADVELELGVAVDLCLVFEIANATGRQHDALERQLLRRGRQGHGREHGGGGERA